MSDDSVNCGSGGGANDLTGLRIGSVFVILATSSSGTLFPVVAKRTRLNNVIPTSVFDFAKYFGSGVIIATAFIHLLSPAIDELTSPCLGPAWQVYPYPLALCMLSIFGIFFVELFAFRWGTARLQKLGLTPDPHGHGPVGHATHGPRTSIGAAEEIEGSEDVDKSSVDMEKGKPVGYTTTEVNLNPSSVLDDSAAAQIIGIGILEFGVLLHSLLIGLTLAVSDEFKVLFVVLVFHQMFEGLGVGSRLAYLRLPARYNWVAIAAAVLYAVTTPLGIAIGLGVRTTYNPDSTTASVVSGVLDALSSGILLYTGLVELLAHEFLFNPTMNKASTGRLSYACICMLFGAGIMALLGRWA